MSRNDLMLERLALGELGPEEAKRVRAALGDDADAQLAALAKDDAEILAASPPAMVAAEVRRRLARQAPQPREAVRWWIPAAALLATGALAWWVARMPEVRPEASGDGDVQLRVAGPDEPEDLPETLRIKGAPEIYLNRLAEPGSERLKDGDVARAGDRVQLQYRAADREQGAIVSIDGRGVATLHFPAEPTASPVLHSGGTIALDHSYELDDAPGFERFFFVTVVPGMRLDVAIVMDAARTLASSPGAAKAELALPRGYEQLGLSLRKQ